MITAFLFFFVFGLFLQTVKNKFRRESNKVPPGPRRLPIFGNLLQLKSTDEKPLHQKFQELSMQYGPVMTLYLGTKQCVVFDDFKMIKQLLSHDDWNQRYTTAATLERSFGQYLGIIWNKGDSWKEIRRFTMKTLKDFGFGKRKSMQVVMEEEMSAILKRIDCKLECDGNIIAMKHVFTLSVLNVLWNMVAGIRFESNDKKLLKFIQLTDELSKSSPVGGGLLAAFPFLRHISTVGAQKQKAYQKLRQYFYEFKADSGEYDYMFWMMQGDFGGSIGAEVGVYEVRVGSRANVSARKALTSASNELALEQSLHREFKDFLRHDILKEILAERRSEGRYQEVEQDFIDVFLKEEDKNRNKLPNYFTDEQFVILMLDLFQAGTETTSNTLEFGILYLMLNPSVQNKMRAEIYAVIGRHRLPTLEDQKSMPYTDATILEVLRMSNVTPVIPRETVNATTIGPYQFQKGMLGIMNTYSIHMNQELWGDPLVFRPERFLDTDNNIVNSSRLLIFGGGRRKCMGEPLARATLFSFLTAVLQNFTFEKLPGYAEPSISPVTGFTLSVKPYSALVRKV